MSEQAARQPVEGEEPAVEPDPAAGAESAVAAAAAGLAALRTSVDTLAATLGREHERAAFREAVIDRLHAENQRLRRGELEALLAPVRGGLFRLHDLARRAAEQCRSATELAPGQAAELLNALADEAVDVLAGVGVERFDPEPGEAYDADRHRPVATVPVPERWRHHTVARVRAAGFATAERTLRRADVVVAAHQPTDQTEPPDQTDQTQQPEGERQ